MDINDASLEAISEHLTSLVRDISVMHRAELVSFIRDEAHFLPAARPATFWLPSTRPPKRDWLCALPLPYLRAALAYFDIVLPVVTCFEHADVLLLHLEGRPVEFVCNEDSGDGYRTVHSLQEDLFDSLATRRASELPSAGLHTDASMIRAIMAEFYSFFSSLLTCPS
jgi:hypothetical protein